MNNKFLQYISWFGVICSIGSYFLLNLKIVTYNSWTFLFLNFLAAIILGIVSYKRKLYAITAQNVIWFIITLIGFLKK